MSVNLLKYSIMLLAVSLPGCWSFDWPGRTLSGDVLPGSMSSPFSHVWSSNPDIDGRVDARPGHGGWW